VAKQKLALHEAAEHLGITADALRQRIRRGETYETTKENGRVYIWLDTDRTESKHEPDVEPDALISQMQARIDSLERQLSEANEANRENRRIIAALTHRIPELPPPDVREKPGSVDETAERVNPSPPEEPREEGRQRPWYQRWFGG
jgi:seryl-tRNA synthetase